MGKRFTHNGVEYEELGGGKVRVIGQAAAAPFTATPLPQSPEQIAAQQRENERIQFARSADKRAQAAADREAAKFDKENAETQTPGDTKLSGDAYLASLPGPLAAQVKALAEGRRAFPTGSALRSPQVQELIAAATQYDPTLDAANAATRVKARSDFTSGVTSRNITAMNTALGHLGTLSEAAKGLDNRSFPMWNTIANAAETAVGDPRVKIFTLARDAVANELMKVFRGSGGSMTEIEEWKKNIDSSDSPDQLNAAIRQGVELLNSRLEAVNDQYTRAMGRSSDPMELLSPHAQQVYAKLTGGGRSDDRKAPPLTNHGTGPGGPPPPNAMMQNSIIPGGGPGAAPFGANQKSIPIPAPMQAEYGAWLAKNASSMTPDQYVAYRRELDAKYGFGADDAANRAWAENTIKQLRQGGATINPTIPGVNQDMTTTEQLRNSAVNNPVGAFAANMGNAGSFGIPGLLVGDQMNALRAANPVSSTLGEIAGGITGTMAGGAGLARLSASRLIGNEAARAAITNPLTADIAYGSMYGATQADDPLYGAVGGAAGALGGNLLGRTVGRFAPRMLGRLPADPLNRGERAVYNAAERTGVDRVTAALLQSGDVGVPATLADVSSDINSLTGAAIRRSPVAAALARDQLGARSRGQFDRFVGAVERDLGPVTNIPQRSEDLIARARAEAGPHYDAAYAAPGASALDLSDLMNRPSMSQALARARRIAAEEGRDPDALGIVFRPDGAVTLHQPNWQTLDYVKRGLDDVLEGYRDSTTGRLNLDTEGRAVNGTLQDLLQRMDTMNPDYAAARAAYAGPAAEREALTRGQAAISMSPDQLGVNFNGATPAQQAQMRLGAQSQLVENAGKLRYSSNPFESTLGTPAMEQRLDTLYPEGQGNITRLLQQRDIERDMAASSNRLVGNSFTAERGIADDAFSQGGGLGNAALEIGANVALGQVPIGTAIRAGLSRGVRDQFKLGIGRRGRDLAEQVVPLAMETTEQAIRRLLSMQERNRARDAIAEALMQGSSVRGGNVGAGASSSVSAALMR